MTQSTGKAIVATFAEPRIEHDQEVYFFVNERETLPLIRRFWPVFALLPKRTTARLTAAPLTAGLCALLLAMPLHGQTPSPVDITLNPTSVTILEGGEQTYTVQLASQPAEANCSMQDHDGNAATAERLVCASINIQAPGGLSLSGRPRHSVFAPNNQLLRLVFDRTDWNVPKTVTVNHDAANTDMSFVVTHTGTGVNDASLTVTVPPGAIISRDTFSVHELDSDQYSVVLSDRPTDPVTVAYAASGASGDVTITPASPLMFDATNWRRPQRVTVAADADGDADDEELTITHAVTSADDNYNNSAPVYQDGAGNTVSDATNLVVATVDVTPVLANVYLDVENDPPANGESFETGDKITVVLEFFSISGQRVDMHSTRMPPILRIEIGEDSRAARFRERTEGEPLDELRFSYTVHATEDGSDYDGVSLAGETPLLLESADHGGIASELRFGDAGTPITYDINDMLKRYRGHHNAPILDADADDGDAQFDPGEDRFYGIEDAWRYPIKPSDDDVLYFLPQKYTFVEEGADEIVIDVRLSEPLDKEFTATFSTGKRDSQLEGRVASKDTDYMPEDERSFTIPAGETFGYITIRLRDDDIIDEGDNEVIYDEGDGRAIVNERRLEKFTVFLENDGTSPAIRGTRSSAIGVIVDNDDPPTGITLRVVDADGNDITEITEADTQTTTGVKVVAEVTGGTRYDGARTVDVTVVDTVTDADAVDVVVSVRAFEIEIPGGEQRAESAPFDITLPADDGADENHQVLEFSGSVDGSNIAVASDTVTLLDDDGGPSRVTLAVSPTTLNEGDGTTPITVTATLDPGTFTSATAVVLTAAIDGATPTAADFTGTVMNIDIPANTGSGSVVFNITPTEDNIAEADRTLEISGTLDAGGGLTLVAAGVPINITDNDTPALIFTDADGDVLGRVLDPAELTAPAAGDTTSYRVALATRPTASVTVSLTTQRITLDPIPGKNLLVTRTGIVSGGPLTFEVGDWSTPRTVMATLVASFPDIGHDRTDLGIHGYLITHDASSSGDDLYDSLPGAEVLFSLGEAAAPPPAELPKLTIQASARAPERAGAIEFEVSLNNTIGSEVTVAYSTIEAIATPGQDYTAVSNATLTIAARQATGTITITVMDDDVAEDAQEALQVVLKNPSTGIALGALSIGNGFIIDDDGDNSPSMVVLSLPDRMPPPTTPVAYNEGQVYRFVVGLAGASTDRVVVNLANTITGATLNASALTFETTNWNRPQTMEVTIAHDNDAADGAGGTLGYTVASSDAAYAGLSGNVIEVSGVRDDDTAERIRVTPTNIIVPAGMRATYAVQLGNNTPPPTHDVTVTATITGTNLGLWNGTASASTLALVFATGSWDAVQSVTVTNNGSAGSVNITHAGQSADVQFNGLTAASVSAETTSDVERGLLFSLPDGSPLPSPIRVPEQGSTTYRVSLATSPDSRVIVDIDAGGVAGLTAAPTSLTFEASRGTVPMDVVLTAADDDNLVNEAGNLVHGYNSANTATGYLSTDADTEYPVIIEDHDAPSGLTLAITPNALNEGDTNRNIVVTVGYAAGAIIDAAADVVVTLAGDGTTATEADFTAATNPITITIPANANSATGTLTVSAVNDDIDEGRIDGSHEHHLEVTGVVTARGATLTATATLAINDDDTRGITLAPAGTVAVDEEATAAYTVVLDTQPTAEVTVELTGFDAEIATVTPTVLTFATGAGSGVPVWNQPQTVTVAGVADDTADDESTAVTHTASGGDYTREEPAPAITATQAINVTDNDDPGLTITDADGRALGATRRLVVHETASVTYQVALATEPTGAVAVAITLSDAAKATVSPTALTFTAEDWSAPQPVTLTGSPDTDSDDVTDLSLIHDPSSTNDSDYDGLANVAAGVTVLDTTTPQVIVSHNAIVVPENAAVAYRVRVTAAPTGGDVFVTPVLAAGVDEDAPFGARFTKFDPELGRFVRAHLGTPLVFTAENWTAWQTVRIHAPIDDDATSETFHITHVVSTPTHAANYAGVTPKYEDGAGSTVDAADSIRVALQEPGRMPVFDRAYLLAAPADGADNYGVGERIEVVLNFVGPPGQEAVPVYVDDRASGARPPTLRLQIGDVVRHAQLRAGRVDSGGPVIEAGQFGQLRFFYDVVVGDRDADRITLAPNALQLNGSRLTYGAGRVPLGELSLAAYEEGQDPQRPLHRESYGVGPDYALVSIEQNVRVNEDADQILFTVTSTAARDTAITIPYATGAPDAAATADNATADNATAAATAGADYVAAAATLTIVAGETTAVITIDLHGDVIDEADEVFTVQLAGPSPPLLAQPGGVTMAVGTITDDDDAPTGIALTARNEGDTADITFIEEGTRSTVVLVKAAPQGGTRFNEAKTVRVSVAGISEHADPVDYLGPVQGSNKAMADFKITIPQGAVSGSASVRLELPVDDNIRETNETLRISGVVVTLTGEKAGEKAGEEAGRETEDASIAVQPAHVVLTDNDAGDNGLPRRVMLAIAPDTLGEDAGATDVVVTASFDAATNNIPTAVSVVVTVAGDGATTTAEDFTGGETITLEIAGLADSGTGTIQLAPVDDDIDEPVQNLAITATAVLDADNTLEARATLAITDNDSAGVVLTDAGGEAFEDAAAALTVAEDGTVSYMVALASQPTGPVTLDIAVGDGAKAAAAPASLTFEPDDWQLVREVVVSGLDDADNGDEAVTITHVASSAGDAVYNALAAVELGLAVEDDDQPGVIATPSAVMMNEGGTSIYSVQLATQPAAAVTLTVEAAEGDDTAIALSPDTLVFDAANWNVGQPVTLTAPNDADIEDEMVTIVHSAASEDDAAYAAMADVEVPVTIADEDEIDISVSTERIALGEERAATYTVSLDAAPTGELTLTAAFAGDTPPDDASVQPAALTFTAENWDVPGTLTVSALADEDGLDETYTLTHTPTGGGYGDDDEAELPSLTVEITDNDAPRLLAVGIAEGAGPMSGDTYGIGEQIMLQVEFSRPVAVQGSPQLKLIVGENDRLADYVPPATDEDAPDEAEALASAEPIASTEPIAQEGGGDADAGKLIFAYTIQAGDEATEGIGIPEDDPLELGAGDAIVDAENDDVQAFVVPDMEVFEVDIPADATKVDGDQDFMLTAEAGGEDGIIKTDEGTTAADGITHTPAVVTLSGSGKAGEMDRIGYAWSLKGGAAGPDWLTLEGANKAMATFNVPNIRSSMNLTFVLTVTNTRTENEATDEVEVQIAAANAAPTVVLTGGTSRTAEEGTDVTLDASGSVDPEGEALTFTWLLADGNPQHVRPSANMNTATVVVGLGVNVPDGSQLTFALTVTDEGDASTAAAVVVTITSTPLGRVLEHALSRFGRALGTSAVDTLGDRFAGASARRGSAGGLAVNLGGAQMHLAKMMPRGLVHAPGTEHGARGMNQVADPAGVFMADHFRERMVATKPLPIRLPTLDRNALMRSTFEINLGRGEDALGASAGGAEAGVGWSLWGRFDNRIFEAEPEGEGITLEGSAMIGYVGADARLGGDQNVLLGLAVSNAESEVDYQLGDLPGDLAIRMVSLHPYANWELSDRLSVWGALGIGGGGAQIISDKGHDLETDIDMSMVAVGGRNDFAAAGRVRFAAKGDLLVVTTKADGIEGRAVDDIDTNVQRLRLGVEASNTLPVGDAANFVPSVELAARVDAGDAETGFGLEIGIGAVLVNTNLGLSADARIRQLVTHAEEGIAETGISVALLYDPGGPSLGGLSARLTPTWGDMQSAAQAMWQGDAPMFANLAGSQAGYGAQTTADGTLPYNMNAELQYDILLSKWSVSPYGSMNVHGASDRRQWGLRINALQMENGGSLNLDLFGEQATGARRGQQADAATINPGIQATLNLRF